MEKRLNFFVAHALTKKEKPEIILKMQVSYIFTGGIFVTQVILILVPGSIFCKFCLGSKIYWHKIVNIREKLRNIPYILKKLCI